MKKLLFGTVCLFLFLMNVNAQDIETKLSSLKDDIITIKQDAQNLEKERLNKKYPIGSIYITTTYSSPNEVTNIIGGTWESYASGKTLVGVDIDNTDFNIVNKTGGNLNKIVTLDNLPKHAHSIPALSGSTSSQGSHSHNLVWGGIDPNPVCVSYIAGSIKSMNLPGYEHVQSDSNSATWFKAKPNGSHSHSITTNENTSETTGSGTSLTNLQPYITVYMYKRVA